MKIKTTLLLALCLFLVAGCVIVNNKPLLPLEPIPPHTPTLPVKPKFSTADGGLIHPVQLTPRLRRPEQRRIVRTGSTNLVVPPIPTFTFKTNGNFRIDASTNLTSWWQVAVVYDVTNVTITSATTTKRPMLFYRLTKL